MGDVMCPGALPELLDLESRAAPEGATTLVPGFGRAIEELERISSARMPVLILGETGTGKELFARFVHDSSKRAGPLIAVNCAAIPPTLTESQLFGHCRGAFSGALRDEPGFVRAARGGTLFLDEVGDLAPAAQGALLRVLQEGEVVPVGATLPVRVDIRVVSATNRDLPSLVVAGAFRADLLARLDGANIHLPPLRERRVDIGLLVATLLHRLVGPRASAMTITPSAAQALAMHAWPGNIRGLEQCLARACAVAAEVIELRHLPPAVAGGLVSAPSAHQDVRQSEPVRDVIVAGLRAHRGNVAAVARSLGRAPVQIHRWMRRFGIDPNDYRHVLDVPRN